MKRSSVLVVLALSACASDRSTESSQEILRKTRVTIRLENSTMRRFFREIERQTGITVATECECGRLQEVIDEPGFSLILEDVSARAAFKLGAKPRLSGHCGQWQYQEGRLFLSCGLVMPDK